MAWKLVGRQQKWLEKESGATRKDWGGKVRVALAFPNRYSVGMSNLGFQSVYGLLNAREDVVCERVFYPEPEDMRSASGRPRQLLSVESQRPVRDFHLLAFSIPFENDYTHVLEMLAFSGIPARSGERGPSHPLVAAGGVAVFLNPEPLADFIDFFFIGEAEALLDDFWAFWNGVRHADIGREELLKGLAETVEGVYVPRFYEVAYRAGGALDTVRAAPGVPNRVAVRRADLSRSSVCRTLISTPNTEFSDIALMEIGRGCGHGCRFCAAGYAYRPPRCHSAEKLVDAWNSRSVGASRLGLVSAAVSDHPEIDALCRQLLDEGASLSFSSLRADAMTDGILASMKESGRQAVAIAPEAGSDRLRRAINKHLSDDQIHEAAERLVAAGILNLKLYFMIGLPTETLDDLDAIVELTKRIKERVVNKSREMRRLGDITLSVNSFIPKPFTPFQWAPFAGVSELRDRARRLRKALQKVPNVKVHFDHPKWAYIQCLLARGDRRAGRFIESVALDAMEWPQALKSVPFNPDYWVMREREKDELFPWEILDNGVERAFLRDEYQNALDARESAPCIPDRRCVKCGVCRRVKADDPAQGV